VHHERPRTLLQLILIQLITRRILDLAGTACLQSATSTNSGGPVQGRQGRRESADMTDDPLLGLGGDGGRRPVVGHAEKMTLDADGVAELQETTALRLERLAERREEGDESPEAQLHWEAAITPDFSAFSDEQREAIESQIEQIRADSEWRARLKRKLEQQEPDLARLMEVDPS
jgi:hypothetical protein